MEQWPKAISANKKGNKTRQFRATQEKKLGEKIEISFFLSLIV